MTAPERGAILRDLHRSLNERWRPEDVAQHVIALLDLTRPERDAVDVAAGAGREKFYFTMSRDFRRPCDMSRQLKVAEELFGRPVHVAADDVDRIERWIRE